MNRRDPRLYINDRFVISSSFFFSHPQEKPVAFAVRTNVAYDGTVDDDSPVHGYAVSFNVREYLHIKVKISYQLIR